MSRNNNSNNPEVRVKKLAKLPCNQTCPNCATNSKHGFATVCIKFHTFVCNNCKSSHQAISHRCKSLTMSTFTMDEIEELERKGNDYAKRTWLAKAPPVASGGRPSPNSDLSVFKSFVVNAYERKLYYSDYNSEESDDEEEVQDQQVHQVAVPPPAQVAAVTTSTHQAPVADLLDFTTTAPTPSNTTTTTATTTDFASFSADFGDFQTAAAAPPPAVSSGAMMNGALLQPPPPPTTTSTTGSSSKRGLLAPPPSSSSSIPKSTAPSSNNSNNTMTSMHNTAPAPSMTMNGGNNVMMTNSGGTFHNNNNNVISNMMAPTLLVQSQNGIMPGMMNGYPSQMNNGMQMSDGRNHEFPMRNMQPIMPNMHMNTAASGFQPGMSNTPSLISNTGMYPNNTNGGMVFGQEQQPMMSYHAQGMQATVNMNTSMTLDNDARKKKEQHDPFAGLSGF